jgi:hypothetical protein
MCPGFKPVFSMQKLAGELHRDKNKTNGAAFDDAKVFLEKINAPTR